MKVPLLKNDSIFRKLFLLHFLIAVLPIALSWIYFLYIRNSKTLGNEEFMPFVYYGLLILTFMLAMIGAFYFSKKLSKPITQFKKSALEIARGNFSLKVRVQSKDEIGRLAMIFNYMVEEVRRLNEKNLYKIINEKNKTETILKNIADSVIITDPQNKIILINSIAKKRFGLSGTDFLERPVDEFIHNEDLIKFIHNINDHTIDDTETIEITVYSPGETKPEILQARAARIEDDKKELIGIATILRDITREKEIDRLKTELVSLVAHELRSPLTCISGFSELLLDQSITHEQLEEYASIILKESNRLSDLINKFLDISKIEAGKSQLRKSPVDMKLLIDRVLDFNSQLSEKKNIHVSFESPSEVSTIYVDRDMMEQVVLNLFSNAVKYSPENTELTIRITELDDKLILEFEDRGYGISEESLPKIFNKFYRITDNDQIRDIAGSGLGLSLVKEIVEIHQGNIQVKSKLGEGSNFIVTLPKTPVMEEELAHQALLI
ncbi:MAG: PAS domain-containing sensor histidine kinase [bacterium]